VSVECRSLASLVRDGVLPATASIVKIDTEGHDLEVLRGMGTDLQCDVIMVEYWSDLPQGLGLCPWNVDEGVAVLAPRGFSHFACIVHRGEVATLQWDDARMEQGALGNIVFVHDRVLERVLPALLECASLLAYEVVATADVRLKEVVQLHTLAAQLHAAAEDREARLTQLQQQLDVVRQSRSWRLTRPLRAIKRRVQA
jgi:hypothetical protein